MRKGDWIQTFSGGQFWPLDPRPDEIKLIDIAAGLSKECRYAGQCLAFYSVAEHSVLMTRDARRRGYPRREQRAVLLHDSSEGVGIRDIPRPIKGEFANYREIEHRIMCATAARFDFDWPLAPHLKELDEAIGLAEEAQIMAPPPEPWRQGDHLTFKADKPLDVRLELWTPDVAFARFMAEAALVGAA